MRISRELQKTILQRDGFACQKCGAHEYLHVHHLDGTGGSKSPNNRLENLVTWCKTCHNVHHGEIRQKGKTIVCPTCTKHFYVSAGDLSRGKGQYCSRACFAKARVISIICYCEHCGKEFTAIPGQINRGRGKYCSKECQYEAKTLTPLQRIEHKKQRIHNRNNSEEGKAYMKQYAEENREKLREYQREYKARKKREKLNNERK